MWKMSFEISVRACTVRVLDLCMEAMWKMRFEIFMRGQFVEVSEFRV